MGVPTPIVYEVDRVDMSIVMEFIEGKQVKLVLNLQLHRARAKRKLLIRKITK